MIQIYNQLEIRDLLDFQMLPTFLDYKHIIWMDGLGILPVLQPRCRGPEYVGQCTPKISCSSDNDTAPYIYLSHSQQQCGSLSRLLPLPTDSCPRCSNQADCETLCWCSSDCGHSMLFECPACDILDDTCLAPSTAVSKSLSNLVPF